MNHQPLSALTPRVRTLVAIDVEQAWKQHGKELATILSALLPGNLSVDIVTTDNGQHLDHVHLHDVHHPKTRFSVRPGFQLVCDRTAGTAASMHRRDVDALYHRKEVSYDTH